MALPKQVHTVYEVEVPTTGKKVKFRPFIVKEQKALLIAQQSEDEEVMLDTLKEVVSSCVQTKDFDVDKLAVIDLEFLLTNIRAKSVGEVAAARLLCDEDPSHKGAEINIDLTKIKVIKDPNHTNKIELFADVGVVMKYPSLKTIRAFTNVEDETNVDFEVAMSCIDYIYDKDQIYYAADHTREELVDFIENLSDDSYEKIAKFFKTMPVLKQEVEFVCETCGKQHKKMIQGLTSFF